VIISIFSGDEENYLNPKIMSLREIC